MNDDDDDDDDVFYHSAKLPGSQIGPITCRFTLEPGSKIMPQVSICQQQAINASCFRRIFHLLCCRPAARLSHAWLKQAKCWRHLY